MNNTLSGTRMTVSPVAGSSHAPSSSPTSPEAAAADISRSMSMMPA